MKKRDGHVAVVQHLVQRSPELESNELPPIITSPFPPSYVDKIWGGPGLCCEENRTMFGLCRGNTNCPFFLPLLYCLWLSPLQ